MCRFINYPLLNRPIIVATGVEIRSVSDVKLIRDDVPIRPPHVHLFPGAEWTLELDFARVLFLSGPSGCGKTQWAVHQFRNPLVVSHMDTLRQFRRGYHDGIVFDDMSFAHLPRESVIHLVDWDEDREIHCRYRCADIPRQTKKIFTTNMRFDQCFPFDESGAIRRRFSKFHTIAPGVLCYRAIPPAPEEDQGHPPTLLPASSQPQLRGFDGLGLDERQASPLESSYFGSTSELLCRGNRGISFSNIFGEEADLSAQRRSPLVFHDPLNVDLDFLNEVYNECMNTTD